MISVELLEKLLNKSKKSGDSKENDEALTLSKQEQKEFDNAVDKAIAKRCMKTLTWLITLLGDPNYIKRRNLKLQPGSDLLPFAQSGNWDAVLGWIVQRKGELVVGEKEEIIELFCMAAYQCKPEMIERLMSCRKIVLDDKIKGELLVCALTPPNGLGLKQNLLKTVAYLVEALGANPNLLFVEDTFSRLKTIMSAYNLYKRLPLEEQAVMIYLLQTKKLHGTNVNELFEKAVRSRLGLGLSLDLFKALHVAGADINKVCFGNTLLLETMNTSAVRRNTVYLEDNEKSEITSFVQWLVDSKADVNAQNQSDWDDAIPLHRAVTWGLLEPLKYMVDHKADITLAGEDNLIQKAQTKVNVLKQISAPAAVQENASNVLLYLQQAQKEKSDADKKAASESVNVSTAPNGK